jgi:hypothetical protein
MVGAAPTWVIAQQPPIIGTFDPSFTAFRSAIYAGLIEQIATFPLPVGGGFTYQRDPTLGVFTRKTDSFGPILTERAETTGRGTFTLTANYTRLAFDSLDGVNLNRGEISRSFLLPFTPALAAAGLGLDATVPVVIREEITADVFNIGALFGVTDRVDVGIVFPFLSVKVRERLDGGTPTVDVPSLESEAAGLGDMVLRSKYNFWEWPEAWGGRLGFAASLDIRLPTGNKGEREQFTSPDVFLYQPAAIGRPGVVGPGISDPPLGAGIVRVKPLLIASGSWFSISPHVNLGAELGTTQGITNDLVYAVGLEFFPFRWATFSADLLGRYAFDVKRDRVTQTGEEGVASPDPSTVSASFGVKANPIGTLLVVLNLLVPLNDTGLRAKAVPSVGLEWSF